MLFGRGQWAVFGLDINSFPQFQTTMSDPMRLITVSQLVANLRTRFENVASIGINPFGTPRRDEVLFEASALQLLSHKAAAVWDYFKLEDKTDAVFHPDFFVEGFGSKEEEFLLDSNIFSTYGFWLVFNDYDDVTDVASKKEAIAYEKLGRPYKFTVKGDKMMVETTVKSVTVPIRKQFPVIVDFQTGRVFVASSNKDEVLAARAVLENMGAKIHSLYWDFKSPDWPHTFLTNAYKQTRFSDAFEKRAEERARFTKEEIEKLEDRTMEKVVSSYFSMTELDSEMWIGLKTPARAKMSKAGEPVACGDPTMVTVLNKLTTNNEFELVSAAVVFQELFIKRFKETETTVRKDLFTLTIDDGINLVEAGAAMLKGFDLPKYKNTMKQFLKQKGQAEIKDYWYEWLMGMRISIEYFVNSVTSVLEIDKQQYGLKAGHSEQSPEAQIDLSDIVVH